MSDHATRIRELIQAAFQAHVTIDDLVRAGAINAEDRAAAQAEFDRLNEEDVRRAHRGLVTDPGVEDDQGEPDADEVAARAAPSSTSSTVEQRAHWRQRAGWLADLGLAPGDDVRVEIIEEVANAALTLLDENERLRDVLVEQCEALLRVLFRDMLDKPGAPVGQDTSSTGPVAREREGRLCVITGVPSTWGADGSRYFDPEVARRLDLGFREMFASGSSVSIRAWADLTPAPAADKRAAPTTGAAHPERLGFIPSDLLDRGAADAALAHVAAAHVAEDAFADYVEDPTPQQAVLTEQTIASLRYEWEVLIAVVRRLLETQQHDRRIGRWLYGSLSEGTRTSLGDMAEWPWLLDYPDDS